MDYTDMPFVKLRGYLHRDYLPWHDRTTVLVSEDLSTIAVWPYQRAVLNQTKIVFKESQNIYVPFKYRGADVHLLDFHERAQI